MNCTGCPSLRYTMRGSVCALGVRTARVTKDGYRIRHPLETCKRPKTDAEVAQRLDIIARGAYDENNANNTCTTSKAC